MKRDPVIHVTAEFVCDCVPEAVEAFLVFHDQGGDTRYRLVDFDPYTCSFTAATPEGEALLHERAVQNIRRTLEP